MNIFANSTAPLFRCCIFLQELPFERVMFPWLPPPQVAMSKTDPLPPGTVGTCRTGRGFHKRSKEPRRFNQSLKFFDMATYGDRTLEKPSVTLYLLSLLAQRLRPPALGGGSPLVYWCLWCLLNTTSSRISLLLQLVPPSAEFLCQILSILNLFSLKRLTWLDSVCCFFM